MHTNTIAAAAVLERRALAPMPAIEIERGRKDEWLLGTTRVARYHGARRWRAGGEQMCKLVFQCASRSMVTFPGRAADSELTAGHWIAHVSPSWDAQTAWGSDVLSIAFPAELLSRSMLLQLQSAPEAAMRIGGAAQMCLELARTCIAHDGAMSDAVAATLGESLVEMAKLAIIEQSCGKRGETIRETVRARILGFVNRNLADPELTIERIAGRMHCTKRYLHKVFSEDGETLNQYIWTRRLELCRVNLARPDLSAKSITEIAFGCGFSNAAHFSRSFRARFGESPRAYRRGALA